MKKIIYIYLSLWVHANFIGQPRLNPAFSFEDAINNSEYVFEGIIIKDSTYFRDNKPVKSEIVKVTKVFRGKLNPGTVEIVNFTECVVTYKNRAEYKKCWSEKLCIFFCRNAKELPYDPEYNININDNKVLLTDYHNDPKYWIRDRVEKIKGLGYTGLSWEAGSKAKIYDKLKKYKNLNIPDSAEPEPLDTNIPDAKFVKCGHDLTQKEIDSIFNYRKQEVLDSIRKLYKLDSSYPNNKKDSLPIGIGKKTIRK
jgi:hypothetical protein